MLLLVKLDVVEVMAGIQVEMLIELGELMLGPDNAREQVLLLELDEPAEVRRDVHDVV